MIQTKVLLLAVTVACTASFHLILPSAAFSTEFWKLRTDSIDEKWDTSSSSDLTLELETSQASQSDNWETSKDTVSDLHITTVELIVTSESENNSTDAMETAEITYHPVPPSISVDAASTLSHGVHTEISEIIDVTTTATSQVTSLPFTSSIVRYTSEEIYDSTLPYTSIKSEPTSDFTTTSITTYTTSSTTAIMTTATISSNIVTTDRFTDLHGDTSTRAMDESTKVSTETEALSNAISTQKVSESVSSSADDESWSTLKSTTSDGSKGPLISLLMLILIVFVNYIVTEVV